MQVRSAFSGKLKKHVTASRSLKTRRRLSAKAKQLRKEFYTTVLNPTADEKRHIRECIGRLPGCEWYLESNRPDLNYQSLIRRQRGAARVVENIRREKISWLTQSLQHYPNPDLNTILIWAQNCNAEPCWVYKHVMTDCSRLQRSACSAATDGRIHVDNYPTTADEYNPTTDEYKDPDDYYRTCQCPPFSCACAVYNDYTPPVCDAGAASDSHWHHIHPNSSNSIL